LKPKIAVYTIALNEQQFVQRWYDSAKDADYLLIADTGSTDNTARFAQKLGVNVVSINISPWRFDDARNAALALLPKDIDLCISLDMDEILTPGWRKPLEDAWSRGITRPKYKHVWSWNSDGSPGLEFAYDHVHARHGYRWKNPVHEILVPYSITETSEFVDGIETHHYPDKTKSRSQYLPLLKMSVDEDPYNDRNAYYYARELFFYGEYEKAAKEFRRHLALPTAKWKPERAASMRYLAKVDKKNSISWYQKAISEDPGRREAKVELAMIYYANQEWELCSKTIKSAIAIGQKPLDYLCEDFAWGSLPYDLAAISSYNLKNYEEAVAFGKGAARLEPSNPRLIANIVMYEAANANTNA
jgi:glycosyltransferase involved in cell wall biosynthesis